MLSGLALRSVLKSSVGLLSPSSCSPTFTSALTWRLRCGSLCFAVHPPVRHYAKTPKQQTVLESQLSDIPPTMLKNEYSAVPLAATTDDIVKRLLSLELASKRDKVDVKKEQLIAKVQRDPTDRDSVEVKVAELTAMIRNCREHLQKHHKDKENKRKMLLAVDRRNKILKNLRLIHYEAFEKVCEQLDITYTFPPEYYRRATHRWIAKKAFCIQVFKEVQKQKTEQKLKMRQSLASKVTTETKNEGTQ